MFFAIKQILITFVVINLLSLGRLSASTLTQNQLHAVLTIVSTFITSSSSKSIALKKVSDYAQSNGDTSTPTLEDYVDAGTINVTANNLFAVNEALALSSASNVDSDTKLQALINQVLATAPVITILGANPLYLAKNSNYIEDNVTALDNIDGDISGMVVREVYNNLNLTIASEVNTSSESNYTITYNITDSDNNPAIEVNRSVRVSANVDTTAPTFDGVVNDYNVSVEENQLSAIDINASDTDYSLRYSIKDGNSSLFNIDVGTGEVTFKVAPDYESGIPVYTFTAVVSDGSTADVERLVTINILDVYDLVPIFNTPITATIDENTIIAIELNASNTTNYSIDGGVDAGLFDINATTGVVSFSGGNAPDYDSGKHSYSFTAVASDSANNRTEQTIVITIEDLNDEAPIWNLGATITVSNLNASLSVEEEQGTAIQLNATDVDSADNTIVYTIADKNASFFTIDNTGLVSFKALPNYESGFITYTFNAIATDGINNSNTLAVTINLDNIIEVGLKKTGQTLSYNELGTVVTSANLEDDGFSKKGQINRYSRNPSTGIVSDNTLSLDWKDNNISSKLSWTNAITYCSNLILGTHSDWRLPSYKELETLVDYGPLTGFKVFDIKFINGIDGFYWTSTAFLVGTHSWGINFQDGKDARINTSSGTAYVTCVRTATLSNY